MNVELPNGEIAEFPDDMPQEQIQSVLQKQFRKTKEELPKQSWTDLFGSALKRGGADIAEGASETGRNIGNFVGSMIGMPNVPKPNYEQEFGAPSDQQKNIADKFLQFAPDLATAIALPETKLGEAGNLIKSLLPKVGKYVEPVIGNAVSQGIYSATQSPDSRISSGLEAGGIGGTFSGLGKSAVEGSPLTRALSKMLIGGGLGTGAFLGAQSVGAGTVPSLLTGLGTGLLTAKYGISPSRIAKETALEGATEANSREALDAAKRLGLKYITPAEASDSEIAGFAQGGIGKTQEGYLLKSSAQKERVGTEKDAINKLFKTVYDKEALGLKKDQFYESAYKKSIPQEDLLKLKDNEVFKDALKTVKNDSAYKEDLKGVSENSVRYIDQVKQALDDMIEEAPKKKAAKLRRTQKQLLSVADNAAPEYQSARGLAEREITRGKMEDFFDKRQVTGSNFAKFLQSQKNVKKLQNNLRNVPEAQQMVEDMRLVFPRLINPQSGKGAEASSRTSMVKSREISDYAIRQLKQALSGGNYDKTAVNTIINPNWIDELSKINAIPKSQIRIGKAAQQGGKVLGQSVGQE